MINPKNPRLHATSELKWTNGFLVMAILSYGPLKELFHSTFFVIVEPSNDFNSNTVGPFELKLGMQAQNFKLYKHKNAFHLAYF